MYVLDENLDHCEPWVTGVIFIGGHGTALGYKDEERTKKQFFHHPVSGEWLFRTGDLGRMRPGGLLEILGREDTQVKINGFRIELGEIEKIAMEDDRVINCCAVVSEVRSTPQLVLFVTSASTSIDVDGNSFFKNIRNELSVLFTESLPSYMIPRAIVFMDNIPLTSNGKV